jgi:hypothetical protein
MSIAVGDRAVTRNPLCEQVVTVEHFCSKSYVKSKQAILRLVIRFRQTGVAYDKKEWKKGTRHQSLLTAGELEHLNCRFVELITVPPGRLASQTECLNKSHNELSRNKKVRPRRQAVQGQSSWTLRRTIHRNFGSYLSNHTESHSRTLRPTFKNVHCLQIATPSGRYPFLSRGRNVGLLLH